MEKGSESKGTARYARRIIDALVESVFLLTVVTVFYIVLLFLVKPLWHIANIGPAQEELAERSGFGEHVEQLLQSSDLIELAIRCVVSAFLISLVVGTLLQLFYIARYVYFPRGGMFRLVVFGLPLTYVVALYLMPLIGTEDVNVALAVAFVPTILVFMRCFDLVKGLVPELGDIFVEKKE
ncbi:MAG: hypothetical protein PHY31_05605 [Smithellaceae bacterium]|nr:hypothetical protein [Smithellaceae bacterium]